MMPELIIEPETFKIQGDRVRMKVRMPWYRALPLSSVADENVQKSRSCVRVITTAFETGLPAASVIVPVSW